MTMVNPNIPDPGEHQKLVQAARVFTPLLVDPDLSDKEIDAMIEELRPLRMHIHAIDYGDAPGFRPGRKDSSLHR
jgi:hypothetical protein